MRRRRRPLVALIDDPHSSFPLQAVLGEDFEILVLRRETELTSERRSQVRALVTTTNAGASRDLIDLFPALEVLAVAGGHIDRVDTTHLNARGIPVCATPGLSTEDVADFTMGLILAHLRGICIGDRLVRAGQWRQTVPPLGHSLGGLCLGIFGLGRIGYKLALRATAFGMDVKYCGPRQKPEISWPFLDTLAELARASDILAVTCRSCPEVQEVVDAEVLQILGPLGLLVSISRGAVNQDDLIVALREGKLGGAALDVVADEPSVPAELMRHPKVIVTPHMASKTNRAKRTVAQLVRDNLRTYFADKRLLTPVQ